MVERINSLLFGTLRRQLILAVAVVHAVMMALFVWDLTERQQEMLLDRQTEHATALAQSIATSSSGWLAARDLYGLQEIVQAQSRYPELLFAMILDRQGRILAHSDTALLGRYVRDLPADEGVIDASHAHILSHTAELVDVVTHVILAGKPVGWVRVGLGQQTIGRRLATITRDGILYAIAAILIGSILAGIMGRRLTRRLYAIQAVADEIQTGPSGHRVEVEGEDEAAKLAHAFNGMLDTLTQREAELHRHRDHLAELVEERTAELSRQQAFMTAVLEHINDGIVACNDQGVLSFFNRATRELHGIDQEDLPPARWADHYRLLLEDGVTPMAIDRIPLFRAFNGEEVRDQPMIIANAGGPRRLVLCSGQAMFGKEGAKLGAVISMHDVTAQKQVEADLIQARDAAEEANRAKSVFLANMSHELRTPLNAILGFAQLMERDPRLPDEQRQNLATINKSGRHLLALINDVLEIARIEAGRSHVNSEALDLHDLLKSLTEVMALRARDKGLRLTLEIDPGLPAFISSDIGKLRQILLNLLSNAVKYTPRGEVVLRAGARMAATDQGDAPSSLWFEVGDTGVGIEEAALEKVFQPFFQTEYGIQLGEGTGLGLAICREYAQLLGGELTAESRVGEGSKFRFSMPVESAETPPRPPPPLGRVLALAPGQKSYRVLIAEDDPDSRHLVSELLREVGLQPCVAHNGREAVEAFRSCRPHFIWMDMRMPVMDGYEATRAIRALPGGGRIPIIALTATAFEEDRSAILAAGCNDVMRKPLEADRLFEAMARQLGILYEYAPSQPAAETTEAGTGWDVAEAVGTLPEAVRLNLLQLAEMLDVLALRESLLGLGAEHASLSGHLLGLLDEFRFDEIQRLLAPSAEGEHGGPAAS